MINQHGNFHIFRTQSLNNTQSYSIHNKLMEGKSKDKFANIPLENHFFNESIKAQKK
jgi:hypothetical protein